MKAKVADISILKACLRQPRRALLQAPTGAARMRENCRNLYEPGGRRLIFPELLCRKETFCLFSTASEMCADDCAGVRSAAAASAGGFSQAGPRPLLRGRAGSWEGSERLRSDCCRAQNILHLFVLNVSVLLLREEVELSLALSKEQFKRSAWTLLLQPETEGTERQT